MSKVHKDLRRGDGVSEKRARVTPSPVRRGESPLVPPQAPEPAGSLLAQAKARKKA